MLSGPTGQNDQPDLRNLSFYFCPCEEGDMIFMSSDGVYDNLGMPHISFCWRESLNDTLIDPQALGYTPRELKIDSDDWDKAPYEEVLRVKENFLTEFVKKKISTAQSIAGAPLTPA